MIQLLLTRTLAEFDNAVLGSDEFLSPGESLVINDEMVTETKNLQQEKIKLTLEVQLLLSDVKNIVNEIGALLSPAIEIIYNYSDRFMKARDIFFVAMDTKFKTNDSELEVRNYVMTKYLLTFYRKKSYKKTKKKT